MEEETGLSMEEMYLSALENLDNEIETQKDLRVKESLISIRNSVEEGLYEYRILNSGAESVLIEELNQMDSQKPLNEQVADIQLSDEEVNGMLAKDWPEMRSAELSGGSTLSSTYIAPVIILLTSRATVVQGVKAVITYFSNKKYWLSAELLQTALDNKNPSFNKYPRNIDPLKGTIAIQAVFKHRPYGDGEDVFQNEHTTLEGDAKYALHQYWYHKYTRNGRLCVDISDKYDFHLDYSNWNGKVFVGNTAMVYAQKIGVITPYRVRHTFVR